MAKSGAQPGQDETEPKEEATKKGLGGVLSGILAKLPFAAIGKAISGFFSGIRDKVTGDSGIGAAVKNVRESSRTRLFAIIGLIVILLIILVILLASLAASITAGQIRDQVQSEQVPKERISGGPGSDVSASSESQGAAVTQAGRIPWLEKPIFPNERDFFLKGEWGTDRVPQAYWSLHDALVHWQDLAKIYTRQLREYNSAQFQRILEADK